MKNLETGLLTEADLFLFLDYCELTSGKCSLDHGMNQVVTKNYFFREIPEHMGGYILFAGLEQFAGFIDEKFSMESILFYFEVIRRGIFAMPNIAEYTKRNPAVVKELIALITSSGKRSILPFGKLSIDRIL